MTEKSKVAYRGSNRIGKFLIMYEFLNNPDERPVLKALFDLCFPVLETYPHESGRGMVYICAGDLFDPLAEGDDIPEYRIECAAPGQPFANLEHELGSLPSAGFRFKAIRKLILRVPPAQTSMRVMH